MSVDVTNAVVFLTRRPSYSLLRFAQTICRSQYDVYVVVDDNQFASSRLGVFFNWGHSWSSRTFSKGRVSLIQIDDLLSIGKGYFHGCEPSFSKKSVAWDKALFYFCEMTNPYSHIWFVEDDVFIPRVETLLELDRKHPSEDLLSAENELNREGTLDWHWRYVKGKLPLPWAHSMVCACRVSRSLLTQVRNFVAKNKELVFVEILFNTLALHHKLKVFTPEEMRGLHWNKRWSPREVTSVGVYHPVKRALKQELLRLILHWRMRLSKLSS